jgi:hypothetical protein
MMMAKRATTEPFKYMNLFEKMKVLTVDMPAISIMKRKGKVAQPHF